MNDIRRDARAAGAGARPGPGAVPGLLLALVLVVALVLRVLETRGARLWFDEIYVVLVARQSVAQLLATIRHDIHPPLYFLFVHGWRALGGEGELWLKAPSIAFALGAIAATFALGRRLWSPRAGLIAAAFLALDGAHIHYSQELEVYPLLWLLALGTVLGAATWVRDRRARDAVLFVACAALGAWTHYLVLVITGLTALWGVLVLRREPRALAAWLGLVALALALFAPQAPTLHAQWLQEGAGRYFHWPAAEGLASLGRAAAMGALYLLPVFVALALVAVLDPARGAYAALPLLLCAFVPLGTRLWPWVVTRDMLVILPFGYLLAAVGLDRLRWRGVGLAATAVLLALGARAWTHHRPFAEPRALARAEAVVADALPAGALLVHSETHSLLYFRYYRPEVRSVMLFPAGRKVPFFDAGLVIPDAWLMSFEDWSRARAAGAPWWGVHCDRAYVTRGVASRAGQGPERWFDSLATGRRWSFPPVRVWEGAPLHREDPMGFRLRSPAFDDGAPMPVESTGDGADRSPPLAWSGAPPGTRSFALIVDDPDAPDPAAPRVVWVHWVLVDLPAGTTALPAGASPAHLPPGTREGLNDWKRPGWRGPAPPVGRHRYVHTLFALDTTLAGLAAPSKAELLAAMRGHVLAQARLTGTYARPR